MAEIKILEKYFDVKKVINIINYENYWRDIRQKAKLLMNYEIHCKQTKSGSLFKTNIERN